MDPELRDRLDRLDRRAEEHDELDRKVLAAVEAAATATRDAVRESASATQQLATLSRERMDAERADREAARAERQAERAAELELAKLRITTEAAGAAGWRETLSAALTGPVAKGVAALATAGGTLAGGWYLGQSSAPSAAASEQIAPVEP